MNPTAFATLADREWKTSWKDGTGYLLRSGYAGLILLAAAIAWGGAAIATGLRPSEHAEFSRLVFRWFFRAQFAISASLALVSFARTYLREKERRSLDLVLLSPASPWTILQAKAVGDLGGMILTQLTAVPVLLFLVPLGGMAAGKIVSVELILVGLMAAIGGLSAVLSSIFSRASALLAASGALVFGLLAAPDVGTLVRPRWSSLWQPLRRVDPWSLLERETATVVPQWGASWGVLVMGLGILAAGCSAGALLLRRMHVDSGGRGVGEGFWRRLGRRARAALAARSWGFLLRSFASSRRPLLHRECSLERDLPFRLFLILWLALYLVAVTMATRSGRHGLDLELHAAIAGGGGLVALVILLGRGAVTTVLDKRSGKLEMLLASNVEPDEIVRSRLAGQLQRGFYLFLPPLLHGTVLLLLADRSWENLVRIPLGIAGAGLAVLLASLWTQEVSIRAPGLALAVPMALGPAVVAALLVFVALSAHAGVGAVAALFIIPTILGLYALHVRTFRRAALRP